MIVKVGNFVDGEESVILVLSNCMLVIEVIILFLCFEEVRIFIFEFLKCLGDFKMLIYYVLSFEFMSNLVWYVV